MDYTEELYLLEEYMQIVIQLLAQKMERKDLPSFEYYKSSRWDYRYDMQIMTHRECVGIMPDGKIGIVRGDESYLEKYGILFRSCSYWKGKKYFAFGNIHGRFTESIGKDHVLYEIAKEKTKSIL